MAYNNEKQLAKNPEDFGKGEIVGLAAPEAANNACSVGALIPMMTLGVPGSGTTAVMLGALMILGLQPGPLLFQQHADIAWTVIASMFIGVCDLRDNKHTPCKSAGPCPCRSCQDTLPPYSHYGPYRGLHYKFQHP